METNPAIAIYKKIAEMEAEPVKENKGGLLSKTTSSMKAEKYQPSVDATMRVARYMQDIKNYKQENA